MGRFAIMGVLMLPGFLALKPIPKGEEYAVVDIFGLPMTIFNYGSQVFPPLLIAALLGPLYKLLKKVIPSNIQLIFVPFFAMLIMMPLAAYLIGPAGVYMGSWLAHSLESINRLSPLILSLFIPLIYPFMVPLGLHWPINAIMLVNIRTLGYDYIEGPMGRVELRLLRRARRGRTPRPSRRSRRSSTRPSGPRCSRSPGCGCSRA